MDIYQYVKNPPFPIQKWKWKPRPLRLITLAEIVLMGEGPWHFPASLVKYKLGQLFWKWCCRYVATTLKQFLPEDPEVPFPRCPHPSDVLCHPNGKTGLSADRASSSMQNTLHQPLFLVDPRKPNNSHNYCFCGNHNTLAFSVLQGMGNSAHPGGLTQGCSAPQKAVFSLSTPLPWVSSSDLRAQWHLPQI